MDKFDDVFRILKQYSFEIDEINKDYLCIICNNILSNAHSGPCGCRFCYDCIGEFLKNTKKFCPGDTNECKQEMLNLNENIHYEPSLNIRISKLIVKCPNKCEFKDEIRKIENHIRVCNFQPIICPYLNIGCNQYNLINNDMKNHLLSDIVPHSNLLLELIENMRNEMELMKKDIGELKNENKSLKNEIETIINGNQIAICELVRKERINSDELAKLNKEMMVLKNENRNFKDEMKRIKIDKTNKNMDKTIERIIMNADQQTIDIGEIKNRMEKMENKLNEFMNNSDKIKIQNMNQNLNKFKNKKVQYNAINQYDANTQTNIPQINLLEIPGQFVWEIDDFSKLERNKQIYSKPFSAFLEGYKICLSINIGQFSNGVFLQVYLHLMRGEFDDNLLWPCKLDISIDLINQNNNNNNKISEKINNNNRLDNFRWNKPTSDRNDGIIFHTLQLSNIINLLRNDQLLIKCKTNIPQ